MGSFNTSGKNEIIIRMFSNFNNFEKNQIITILKDVDFSIEYSQTNKEISNKKPILAYSQYIPNRIKFDSVNITNSLAKIFFKGEIKDIFKDIPTTESFISDENGNYLLKEIPSENKKIEIIMDNFSILKDFKIDYSNGLVTELPKNRKFLAAYYVQREIKEGYYLGESETPYFSIEIKNKGNYGNDGANYFLNIGKVALLIDPVLNFETGSITNLSLEFSILDKDIEFIYY